jgi:hypothetical protein
MMIKCAALILLHSAFGSFALSEYMKEMETEALREVFEKRDGDCLDFGKATAKWYWDYYDFATDLKGAGWDMKLCPLRGPARRLWLAACDNVPSCHPIVIADKQAVFRKTLGLFC